MKYRSRADIVTEMLQAADGGATKTRIMYKAYLSYAQLKEYLQILTTNGLMEYDDDKGIYRTTTKGVTFMREYSNMSHLFPHNGKAKRE